jgi:lipopolysaccharide export system permease protein
MQTLPRYVLVEVLKVFAISVSALTLMVVLGFIGREATAQNLPLMPTLRLIPYFLPETLRVTVPMTLLLSCTTVFSRISGANEIVAVKAMGISPMALLWPVYLFAFVVSLATVWLNDVADSWGHANVQRVIVEGAEEIMYSVLQQQRRYSTSSFSINVKSIDGRQLHYVTLIINDRNDSSKMTITAEEAELGSGINDHSERVLKIFLRKGRIEVADRVSFDFPDVLEREIPLTDASRARNGGPQAALTLARLPEAIATAKVQVDEQEQMMAALAAYDMTCGDLDDLTGGMWQMHENNLSDLRNRFFRLQSVPQRRWAGGFACLCFVLVGVPMAISLRNRDFLTSFFLCFLPILLVYYPLMIIGADQVKNGKLPVIFVWAGNGMLVLWGLAMLRRVIRY